MPPPPSRSSLSSGETNLKTKYYNICKVQQKWEGRNLRVKEEFTEESSLTKTNTLREGSPFQVKGRACTKARRQEAAGQVVGMTGAWGMFLGSRESMKTLTGNKAKM